MFPGLEQSTEIDFFHRKKGGDLRTNPEITGEEDSLPQFCMSLSAVAVLHFSSCSLDLIVSCRWSGTMGASAESHWVQVFPSLLLVPSRLSSLSSASKDLGTSSIDSWCLNLVSATGESELFAF